MFKRWKKVKLEIEPLPEMVTKYSRELHFTTKYSSYPSLISTENSIEEMYNDSIAFDDFIIWFNSENGSDKHTIPLANLSQLTITRENIVGFEISTSEKKVEKVTNNDKSKEL
jgi:hypothetical protein